MGEAVRGDLKKRRPDIEAMKRAAGRWMGVMKPLGSLGEMESLVIKLAGIYGSESIPALRPCVLVACADNGVVCEGVSQSDSSVTRVVADQIVLGRSNINVMARAAGADVFAVDAGMLDMAGRPTDSGIIDMCVRKGTDSIARGPAMSQAEAREAVGKGRELVLLMKERGYNILVTGEMGIGNTTTASALSSVLLNLEPEQTVGRGAGLSDDMLAHKREIVKRAIEINSPFSKDPVEILSRLGGLDIAAMCGMFLGGMEQGVPIVIDGFISAVAALIAARIEPFCTGFMLPSHISGEGPCRDIFKELGLCPVINASMRLGEGTGGVCLLPLLNIALAEYTSAHRFGDTEVEQYEDYGFLNPVSKLLS